MTRWMLLSMAVVAMSCATLTAFERGAGAGNGPIQHILDNAKELNLSDDQKTKLQALVKEVAGSHDKGAMAEKIKNNPELRETFKEMKAAKEAGDEAKLKELRQKLMAGEGKAGAGKGEGHGEILQKLAQILTPEQMKKLKEMRESRENKGSAASNSNDKASKPDASKGVPKVFE